MQINVDVFRCYEGKSKEGKAYHLAEIRIPAGAGGRVGTMFSEVPLEVDDDVKVEMQFGSNRQKNIVPRITGLARK